MLPAGQQTSLPRDLRHKQPARQAIAVLAGKKCSCCRRPSLVGALLPRALHAASDLYCLPRRLVEDLGR